MSLRSAVRGSKPSGGSRFNTHLSPKGLATLKKLLSFSQSRLIHFKMVITSVCCREIGVKWCVSTMS